MTPTLAPSAPDSARPRALLRVLCTLFFFSGLPALVYQLVWQRALFRIFGVNIEAVTIVVAAFMLGLGMGSIVGGWLSRRPVMPLLLMLATIEALTAAFGLVSLALFERTGLALAGAPLPVVAAATLLLVLVPTLLMGATLPLLVGHLCQRLGNVGRSVGMLYYANTLGAGAACLLGAVYLFPYLGMRGSVWFAAGINLMVALAAVVAHAVDTRAAKSPPAAEASDDSAVPAGRTVMPFSWAVIIATGAGYVSLSYEILTFRAMSYASSSSALAFAVTLGAFLIGIASGSRRAAEVCAEPGAPNLARSFLWALLWANLGGALMLPILAHLPWLKAGVLGVLVAQTYLIARCWGFVLPAVIHLAVAPDMRAGERSSWLYLGNIVGSVTGTIVTGFVLLDVMGLVALSQWLVALGLLMLAGWWPLNRALAGRGPGWPAVALAVALVPLGLMIPAGSERLFEHLMWKGLPGGETPFAQVRENRSGIITVAQDGTIFGHGVYDGHYSTDLVNDRNGIVRPFGVALFHPAPRRVLMIGLSSASWTQVVAHHPGVESVTVVEINPGYVQLAAAHAEVASVLKNPKVTILADDGRRWLRNHPEEKFDVVVSNTSFHFRSNASNLLSTEFLALVKAHLLPGGVMFYNTTDSARVQRTGCLAFSHGARFMNHMVLSDSPIDWSLPRWKATLEAYKIDGRPVLSAQDPAAIARLQALMAVPPPDNSDAPVAAKSVYEPCPALLKRTEGLKAVTDDNMGTEWFRVFGGG